MSPQDTSRERAALPSLPPRRRTGANLIRSNRVNEEPAAPPTSAPDTEDGGPAASTDPTTYVEAGSVAQPAPAVEASSPPAADPAPAHEKAPEVPAVRAQPAPAPTRPVRSPEGPGAGEGQAALSRWDQLNRRIFSVADPQVEELVELRKALMRLPARQRVLARDRERITESTLVRIGIDLVLRHRDQIEGVTEDELRASLGLEPLRLRAEDPGSTNGPRR